jgi:hypothetical protein
MLDSKLSWRLAAVVLVSVTGIYGQTLGEITGRVSDASGAAVAGATVSVTNNSTNAVRSTVTTEAGDYSLPSLPPGNYTAKVERQGFKAETTRNIDVQVQQTVRLDFTLQVGQVSESIEVVAEAVQLQSENSTVGTVIGNKEILELPLNGRQYLNLVALAPNTNVLSPPSGQAGSRQGGDRANQSISVAGQRIMFDFFTLDGINNTDPNFNTYVVLPSIDALQEFKVQTGVYPAEFGHQATQINVLTKSGGNSYHGSLFEFLRNDKLDAKPYSFTSKPQAKSPFKWNDYGFEFDGPVNIPKLFHGANKLFFMANYEALRRRQNFQSIYSVPTAAMFNGDYSGQTGIIYDPSTKEPFPNNMIPTNRIDPIAKKLEPYYATANVPGTALANNFVRSSSSPLNRDGFVLRLDFVESTKSQWSGRYSWGDENQASQGINLDGTKILTNYEQYMGSNTRILTPNLVNDARFGYTRFFNSIGTFLAFNTDVVSSLGIPNFPGGAPITWGIPNISIINYSSIGDSTEGPYANDNNTLQFVDNLSWIKGKHSFRFGFEFMRQNYNQVGNQFARGQFTFQPNATQSPALAAGDSFADFLLGDMYQSEAAVAIANAKFRRNSYGAWIDDTWKITPKLTLSLGLRYELTPPFLDQLGDLFTVYQPYFDRTPASPDRFPVFMRQGTCTDPYAGIRLRWPQITTVCSNGKEAGELAQTHYRNFAPRVGIAWSPTPKWVIRLGAGDFYNQDIGNGSYFDMARQIAGRFRVNSTQGTPSLFWSNALAAASGGASPQITSPFAFEAKYSHNTTYTWEYLFNVQRQLANNFMVEVGYLGSLSRHLYGFLDGNQPYPGTTPLSSRLPYNTFGVIQLVNDGANGNYNAGSLKVSKRFSGGLVMIGTYTYAKSLDETSGIRVQGYDTLYPQQSFCLQCEKGLSAFDVRHRFSDAIVYDVPVGKGRRVNVGNPFANAVVGGWQIGGALTLQSGLPENITIGGVDRSNTGVGYDRPNATGSNQYADNRTPSRWLSVSAYEEAAAGAWGNLGRNTVITPGIFSIDYYAHKEFQIKERHRLQFRLEAFNGLNHPVWANPQGNILSGAAFPGASAVAPHQGFGTITSTLISMRQMQVALKYSF